MTDRKKKKLRKEVLSWVNEKREYVGLPRRTRLLKGCPSRACECPVARSLGEASVASTWFWLGKWMDGAHYPTPPFVIRFIDLFDAGSFPELYK